jgi:hypothetical protein
MNRTATFTAELERAVGALECLVRTANPGAASGDQARSLVALFARAEKACASGVALFSPVVEETGSYAKAGHGSAAEWLGSLAGSSAGAAKGRLAAARSAAAHPVLAEALHGAGLSTDQLSLVARTAAEVPEAAPTLLQLAEDGASHRELKDIAARMCAAARSREADRARRARVHASRHMRAHQVETGGVRGEFFCDEVQWARIQAGLEAEAKARWKAAGSRSGESLDAHRLDAFLDLLTRGPCGEPGDSSRAEALILINAESLRRGSVRGGELCEIEGIGPVSLDAVEDLLGDASAKFLVTEDFDIKTVTRSSRHVAKCVNAALIARDRTCGVEGCGKRHGLERDHVNVDYSKGGPTELDNLVRLCPEHHDLKTHGGWRIVGKPGKRAWIAPDRPPSAGAVQRAKRVAVAKAKAKSRVKPDRNRPRQT